MMQHCICEKCAEDDEDKDDEMPYLRGRKKNIFRGINDQVPLSQNGRLNVRQILKQRNPESRLNSGKMARCDARDVWF